MEQLPIVRKRTRVWPIVLALIIIALVVIAALYVFGDASTADFARTLVPHGAGPTATALG